MSIYFPVTTKAYYNNIKERYLYDEIGVSENYKSFLNKYVKINSGDRLVKSNISNLTPVSNESDVSVVLPDDVAANYEVGNYFVFKEMEDKVSQLLAKPSWIIDGNFINNALKRFELCDCSCFSKSNNYQKCRFDYSYGQR